MNKLGDLNMDILMAGKSAVKAEGIKSAFSTLFPNEVINIIESTAPSLVVIILVKLLLIITMQR